MKVCRRPNEGVSAYLRAPERSRLDAAGHASTSVSAYPRAPERRPTGPSVKVRLPENVLGTARRAGSRESGECGIYEV